MSETPKPMDDVAGGLPSPGAIVVPTTKVLAIGRWTQSGTPEAREPIMPFEAPDTLRLYLAGKIDQWYFQTGGSGVVFIMNVADPTEAHELLERLPLGQAGMMEFELISIGPLRALGRFLDEPSNRKS